MTVIKEYPHAVNVPSNPFGGLASAPWLSEFVRSCATCARSVYNRREPLLSSTLPQLQWQYVAADVFELNKQHYLLVVDYYSRYVKLAHTSTMTAAKTVCNFHSIFARHGLPEVVTAQWPSVFLQRICQLPL